MISHLLLDSDNVLGLGGDFSVRVHVSNHPISAFLISMDVVGGIIRIAAIVQSE